MKQHTMNWDQTNITHDNKISKYTEIGKIRYKEIKLSFRKKKEWMGRYDSFILGTYTL